MAEQASIGASRSWTPLRFEPVLKRYLWGGRRLGELFAKQIGSESDYAESWELVDREPEQSRVRAGAFAGKTLRELLRDDPQELLGRHAPQPRFPLLVKILDAAQLLSVQVHPNDAQAALMTPPDLGKTEVWHVLAAEPGSKLYAGLKHGIDREQLAQALSAGQVEPCLHAIEPRVGDTIFIPPGTVHALGAGVVIAEFQQSSDVTLRLFDWNRVGADGKPRPLHIEAALPIINYSFGPIQVLHNSPLPLLPLDAVATQDLVVCEKFVLKRHTFRGHWTRRNDDRFRILMVIEGELRTAHDPLDALCTPGTTLLIPAAMTEIELLTSGVAAVLECYLP
jgi:mannose-6-phosphate isomerase